MGDRTSTILNALLILGTGCSLYALGFTLLTLSGVLTPGNSPLVPETSNFAHLLPDHYHRFIGIVNRSANVILTVGVVLIVAMIVYASLSRNRNKLLYITVIALIIAVMGQIAIALFVNTAFDPFVSSPFHSLTVDNPAPAV